jgi:hypothetical protein
MTVIVRVRVPPFLPSTSLGGSLSPCFACEKSNKYFQSYWNCRQLLHGNGPWHSRNFLTLKLDDLGLVDDDPSQRHFRRKAAEVYTALYPANAPDMVSNTTPPCTCQPVRNSGSKSFSGLEPLR